MDVASIFEQLPFPQHLGMELEYAEEGEAAGHVELQDYHSSNPGRMIAHGGVTYSLADTVGGAAIISLTQAVSPTIDMRMDYLAPATGDSIRAEAEVVRIGEHVGTVDVTVTDGEGEPLATARGVYKTGGGDGETAWANERERQRIQAGDPQDA